MEPYIPLILTFILSFLYMESHRFYRRFQKDYQKLVSLGSGMFLAIIFMEIFPILFDKSQMNTKTIFLSVLGGFVTYHVLEKHVYHHSSRKILAKEHMAIYYASVFIQNLIDGFLITVLLIASKSPFIFLIFLPFALNVAASSFIFDHNSRRFKTGVWGRVALAFSILLGSVIGLTVASSLLYPLLAISMGMVLYFTVREELPSGRKGDVMFFLIGVLGVLSVIYLATL